MKIQLLFKVPFRITPFTYHGILVIIVIECQDKFEDTESLSSLLLNAKTSLKIPKRKPEDVNQRRHYNYKENWQIMIYKTQHRQPKIEKHWTTRTNPTSLVAPVVLISIYIIYFSWCRILKGMTGMTETLSEHHQTFQKGDASL